MNAFLFTDPGGLGTLPGRRDFDEDALAGDAGFFVKPDEITGLLNGPLHVEGQTRIHLGRNAAGDDFENLAAKCDKEIVDDLFLQRLSAEGGPLVIGDGLGQERFVFLLLHGFENQRGIGRGVLR